MSTDTTKPIVPQEPVAPTPRKHRTWLRWAAGIAALIAALVVGIAVGIAAQSGKTSTANHTVAVLHGQLRRAQQNYSQAQQNYSQAKQAATTAQNQADNAVAAANKAAQARYAAKMAAADALLSKLRAEQKVVQQNTISQDGVYVVGQDIAPGIYHTSGNGSNDPLNQCYFATLNSTNTSDISDNNNFNGPETVNLNGVAAFQISGGCQWTKIG